MTASDEQQLSRAYAFLRSAGTSAIPHGTRHGSLEHGSFNDHLRGTHDVLARWGYSRPVCLAGAFHSIYGTEGFRGFILDLTERPRVANIIGEHAERLAFLNCAMERGSLDRLVHAHAVSGLRLNDPPVGKLRSRCEPKLGLSGDEEFSLDGRSFPDMLALHLADFAEGYANNQAYRGGVRFLRHAGDRGQPGYWAVPEGGWWSYRGEHYINFAKLLGGVST
jgi:hypothetical protein